MNVLIVDDNRQVMETLCDYLEFAGHQVDCAYNGEEALQRIASDRFDVIVMDIMMPRLDGIAAVERLRRDHQVSTPVLFLTARDQLDDKVAAFTAGGDDYLVKPFATQELLLRLEALCRRGPRRDIGPLVVGDLRYDLETQRVSRAGQELSLSNIQLKILKLLMQKSPALVTRQQLIDWVWGDEQPDSDALRSHIYALRCSLNKGFTHDLLETLHGRGYRLVP